MPRCSPDPGAPVHLSVVEERGERTLETEQTDVHHLERQADRGRRAFGRLLQQLGGGTVIGPLLIGLEKPVQIVPMNATVSDILNIAAIAAYDAIGDRPTAEPGVARAAE